MGTTDEPSTGTLLDGLGVRIRLREGQHLVEAIVVGKVVDPSMDHRTDPFMVIGASVGLDWIEQRGLIGAATDVLAADVLRSCLE